MKIENIFKSDEKKSNYKMFLFFNDFSLKVPISANTHSNSCYIHLNRIRNRGSLNYRRELEQRNKPF